MSSQHLYPNLWSVPDSIVPNPFEDLNLPLPVRAIFARRGFKSSEEVKSFLFSEKIPDPKLHFPDLNKAVNRLAEACQMKEMVAICGDYDADGMTSTALLYQAFRKLGARPISSIPSRKTDGYGLNESMVLSLHKQGIKLLITVDNGVSSKEALKKAKDLSMDVILTDHHTIPTPEPDVFALIHPFRTPNSSPYRCLAGVGLAFIVAKTLANDLNKKASINSARDLFCIGTIADMAPLNGANRILLKEGLKTIHKSNIKGLQALQKLSGIEGRALSSEDIGFQIAPRINAVGRLGEPKLIIDLLTAEDETQAITLARKCDELNRQRKELSNSIELEAVALIESDKNSLPPFIFLAQSHWHQGVIGIVASRLVEKYNRPVALLVGEGEGTLRGSVRAPKGFHVDQALNSCSRFLEKHGGHPAAGGFTVKAENTNELERKLSNIAEYWLKTTSNLNHIKPEAYIDINDIDESFLDSLNLLEPFGITNPTPLFWTRGAVVKDSKVLRGGHLLINLQQKDQSIEGIVWNWGNSIFNCEKIDCAFNITRNYWNGQAKLQLVIKALRKHQLKVVLSKNNLKYTFFKDELGNLEIVNQKGDFVQWKLEAENRYSSKDIRSDHPYMKALLAEGLLLLGNSP